MKPKNILRIIVAVGLAAVTASAAEAGSASAVSSSSINDIPVVTRSAGQPAGSAAAQTRPAGESLASGLIEEEGNSNSEAAAKSYQEVIARFDRERPAVASAIFRLGEVLRKQGKTEEAKVQYGRILREFPDQTQLVQLSQKFLAGAPLVTTADVAQIDPELASRYGLVPATGPQPGRYRAGSFQSRLQQVINRAATEEHDPHLVQLQRRRDFIEQAEAAARNDLSAATKEVYNAEDQLSALRDASYISLPKPLSDDPRYQKLKTEYESWLLQGGQEQAVKQLAEKIKTWVEKIYQPELQSAVQAAKLKVHRAQERQKDFLLELDRIEKDEAAIRSKLENERAAASSAENIGSSAVAAKNSIMANLRQIDGAKEQWALENKVKHGAAVDENQVNQYLRGGAPKSVAGEVYHYNPVGQQPTAELTNPAGGFPAGTIIDINGKTKPNVP